MNETYKLIITIGDCEFSDETEIIIENKEVADEISNLLEMHGKNIYYTNVVKINK